MGTAGGGKPGFWCTHLSSYLNVHKHTHTLCSPVLKLCIYYCVHKHLFVWMLVRESDTESLDKCRTCYCTFYGMEVCTREISHNPLLLMGGAHVNLQGTRDKHDLMSLHCVQTSNIKAHLTSVFVYEECVIMKAELKLQTLWGTETFLLFRWILG